MNKALLMTFICVLFGLWKWSDSPSRKPVLIASAEADQTEIYTASYCSECKRAKAYMKSQGIEFIEHDIEHDIERRREFYERGGKGIPLIFVRGTIMHGFDQEQFEKLRAGRS